MKQLVACCCHLSGPWPLPYSLVLTDIPHQATHFSQIVHNVAHFALWDLLIRSDSNIRIFKTANVANLCSINLNVFNMFVFHGWFF